MTDFVSPWYWVTFTAVGLFNFIIHLILLKKEINKRRAGQVTFTTKFLGIWSILCILCGSITAFDSAIFYIHPFCHITLSLFIMSLYFQFVFMGFYQLSRLYYCFANDKIHSKKGYHNCVFIIMYSIGVIFMVIICPIDAIHIIHHCGIDNKWLYHTPQTSLFYERLHFPEWLIFLSLGMMATWDLITLVLYVLKIRMLYRTRKNMVTNSRSDSPTGSTNDHVQTRIVSILYKIVIITLFYQFTLFIGSSANAVEGFGWFHHAINFVSWHIQTLTLTFCMFIMMDHNQSTYYSFLRVLYLTKLYWIGCCCCKHMVIQQLNAMKEQNVGNLNVTNKNAEGITKRESITKETVYDVDMHDIKPDHAKIEVRRNRSEVETIDDGYNV